MKRWLSVLLIIGLILLYSCNRAKTSSEEPSNNGPETTEAVEKKPRTYAEIKVGVLERLEDFGAFESRTQMNVIASGGSFLLPGFEIEVIKSLEHTPQPLATRVEVTTDAPFFIKFGPPFFAAYTEAGSVMVWDEKSNDYVKQDMPAESLRGRFDSETAIQKELWQSQEFELSEGAELVATLRLEGQLARELMQSMLQKFGSNMTFDTAQEEETLLLTLYYHLDDYTPRRMQVESTAEASGYHLDISIQTRYTQQ